MAPKVEPLTDEKRKVILGVYYNLDSGAAYTSPFYIYRNLRKSRSDITLKNVQDTLSQTFTYTLHKQPAKIRTEAIIPSHRFAMLDTDILSLEKYASKNRNFKFLLIVVDLFHRFIWVRPLKSQKASELTEAFQTILDEIGERVFTVRSDRGTNYLSKEFQRMLKANRITFYEATSQNKASSAERAGKTIRGVIEKYFTHNKTRNWIDDIYRIINNLNHKYHTTIDAIPADINYYNEGELLARRLDKQTRATLGRDLKEKFQIGQLVRILEPKVSKIGEKAATANQAHILRAISQRP